MNFSSSSSSMMNSFTAGMVGLWKQAVTTVQSKAAEYEAEGLGLHYINKRILSMGFPTDTRHPTTSITHIDALSSFLSSHHSGKYMIFNLSERSYDYAKFCNAVIEFKFPGYPAPPLDQIFTICQSLDGWLGADPDNVAVIHCQTGRGRTVSLIACYLLWSHLIQNTNEGVELCVKKLGIPASQLLIPTQKRYLLYVSRVLNGDRPRLRTVQLERVILNGIPLFEMDGKGKESSLGRVRPYLQIFQNSRLLFTSTGREAGIRWYQSTDSAILFPVSLVVQGDILIRVRHLSADLKRISMLRLGFHTGFVRSGAWRLTKSQLDGAATDDKFDDDFSIDIICRENDDLDSKNAPEAVNAVTPHASQTSAYWQAIAARKVNVPLPTAAPVNAATAATTKKSFFSTISFNLLSRASAPVQTLATNPDPEADPLASSSHMGETEGKNAVDDGVSFEDLQKYVAGLGALDLNETENDHENNQDNVLQDIGKHLKEEDEENKEQQKQPIDHNSKSTDPSFVNAVASSTNSTSSTTSSTTPSTDVASSSSSAPVDLLTEYFDRPSATLPPSASTATASTAPTVSDASAPSLNKVESRLSLGGLDDLASMLGDDASLLNDLGSEQLSDKDAEAMLAQLQQQFGDDCEDARKDSLP